MIVGNNSFEPCPIIGKSFKAHFCVSDKDGHPPMVMTTGACQSVASASSPVKVYSRIESAAYDHIKLLLELRYLDGIILV
ncbi:hypothetical protein TNCV_3867911 [Trichonephila clavipes]|nr:hypothetical protein TNCV_3867911 [Trichonephila clavipes]